MICPKCGSLMTPGKKKEKIVFKCPVCGYEGEKGKLVNIVSSVSSSSSEEIPIIKEEMLSSPIVTKVCPKCGNSKAYFQMVQTRSADEPPTRIYLCTKCGYSWREFS